MTFESWLTAMANKLTAISARVELARRYFFDYCRLKAPDFYKPERTYLKTLCDTLQEFFYSDDRVLIVDLPPRHGKSRTLQLFVEWMLGKDHTQKIMTASYNEMLSTTFAKSVRNSIQEIHVDDMRPVYSDIFEGTSIKRGDGAMSFWSLEDGFNSYLATSPKGTATGMGASFQIYDDLIKSAEEAYNENVKASHWAWFTQTMLSRLEEGGKIAIVMTRWASDDLAGKAIEHFGKDNVIHVNMPAVLPDGSMLCDEILSWDSCEAKKAAMGFDIWSANYQQEPIDIKGRLYSSFKTYDGELPKFKSVRSYTDTADTGKDFLCSFVYGVTFQNEAYILDVEYTQDAMEITEPATAEMLHRNAVNVAKIESNNGGRGFARSVEKILRDMGDYKVQIEWFTQHQNKQARILSNATWCMNHIYFPANWAQRWPEFYTDLMRYQRQGKNAHDDHADALTGVCEDIIGKSKSWAGLIS